MKDISWLKQCECLDQYLDILSKHIKSYVQRARFI